MACMGLPWKKGCRPLRGRKKCGGGQWGIGTDPAPSETMAGLLPEMLQAAMTFKYVFDYREGEIYWCTADVGWVTGHTYIVYGPLANGAISLMFEGIPTYPDAGRCWEVVDKHQVNTFYTAPTAIRALQAVGDEVLQRASPWNVRAMERQRGRLAVYLGPGGVGHWHFVPASIL